MAIGGLLAAVAPAERDPRSVVVGESAVASALKAETAIQHRNLSEREKAVAVDTLVDDVVLSREAARLGIGLDDPVIRSLLAQRMRASFEKAMPAPAVDRAELDAEIARQQVGALERVRLAVWFVAKDRPNAAREAEAIARQITIDGITHVRGGDHSPLPSGAVWTEPDLVRVAGALVARAAMNGEIDEPSAPLGSAWGFFVVVPLERRRALPSELEADALAAVIARKRAADVAKAISDLRRDYRLEVRTPDGESRFDARATGASACASVRCEGVN